jgi:hypothetical protein
MLDFNNLKYFPSLFEDLSKPRETYTIVQYTKEGASSSSAQLNNTDVSLYKHYINKAVKGSYLENAILKHIPSESISYNTTNIENTTTSSVTAPEASLYTDIISYNTKLTKASSRLASAAVETVTTENITPLQNSNISPPNEATLKNNTPSLSYNLNRDSVSSTYSKYFFSEDTNTTDKVNTLRFQDQDKLVDNTQVKLFVSEYMDNTENTKKLSEHTIPEPVTPEQICNTDLSNSLHTNIKNSKQLPVAAQAKAKASIEPFSPYSPSIISDYSDIQVPLIKDTPTNAPLIEDDMSVDLHSLRSASYKIKDSISTNTESINLDDGLPVPDLSSIKLTSPTLTEDYDVASTESNMDSLDLPEAIPTTATAPLLDDDSDFNTLHIPGTLNFEETNNFINNQSIDIRDLSNAKSTIVNNNKHIMNIELNLDTLQDRLNSINDESSSLLQEKAELTNKLKNNSHNVEPFTERTANNDNPLYTTYKNAYNSFMQ